jgi:hypothetical protein
VSGWCAARRGGARCCFPPVRVPRRKQRDLGEGREGEVGVQGGADETRRDERRKTSVQRDDR